ncbi:MAG: AAA family ATPase [Chloroflexi bacterium]|nr:AAA family ATPase [Chloroflexota bacterium]
MANLRIQLFQSLTVRADDGPPLDMGSPTARSLFAYLALNRGQTMDRRRLAFQFWPRGSEQAARRNLRQYLHRLRRSLEPVDPEGKLLFAEGNQVGFHPPDDLYLDVAAFETAVAPPRENLSEAINIYKGDLLEELYDDWVAPERERLARLYREALLRLIDQKEATRQYADAVAYAERYQAAEPLLESAYVRLMRLHYAAGDRGRVQQKYEQLTAVLHNELNAAPLPKTAAAYKAMLAGSYKTNNEQLTMNNERLTIQEQLPVHNSPFIIHNSLLSSSPFIGRKTELDWLQDAWQSALNSQGRFVFIQGESGVGKTRLVGEMLSGVDTAVHLFSGRGHEFESMIPYSPLAQALHNAETGSDSAAIPWERFQPPPPWLSALLSFLPDLPAQFPGHDFNAAGQRHHAIEGLGAFLLTLARHRPVILYLDNLHWADGPTWDFLGYLAPRAATARILVIGVARTEDMPRERVRLARKLERKQLLQSLTLARLSQAETAALVRQLMDDDLDPVFARRIYEETEGNPFFIIETTRAVREAGGDWTRSVPTDDQGERPFFAIPLQVQSIIESRLDKLSDDSRAALGVAAAIGREFTFELLQQVSQFETQTLLDALDEWLARGLVRETRESYDFTHEKLSQVAYQQLSRARRQWIHYQVAEFLRANRPDADPAQLAHHYYLSAEPGQALPFLARAGRRALSVRSYAEAREFGLRAIGLLGRFPSLTKLDQAERVDLNLQLAQAYAFTGALPKALQMLQETERMAASLGDMERLARIFHRSSQIFWLRGRPNTADDYARRTLRHAEELDDADLRYAALRMLGRVGIALSHYDDAIAYLLRYVDLAEKRRSMADLPAIYGYLGVAYARVGSWQRAIDAAQKGLELADTAVSGAMRTVARMQLAFVYGELHEWEQALAIAEPARDLWREEGMTPHAFTLRAVVGRCLVQTGQPKEGVAEIQEALKWAEEVDYRVLVHVIHVYLAQAQYAAGMIAEGRGTAVRAAQLAAEAGNRWAEGVALRTQAEIGMRLPRPDWPQIEANLIRAMRILRQIRARPDLARAYLTLRRLYDRAGQSAWAVDCHFRATTIFDELGMADELRAAQGQAAGHRTGAVVIPGLELVGPNAPSESIPKSPNPRNL